MDRQDSDRSQRIRSLFHEVVGLQPDEWGARLDDACGGDEELRHEVLSLLEGLRAPAPSLDQLLKRGSAETADNAFQMVKLRRALNDRYDVEHEIGRGGMATVYLAEDLKHERKVAIKVLRPELAAVVGVDRFLGEIRTAATLQHPHILPLHDSGAAAGLLYYTMPFVAGESLRTRIDREGPLPWEEAVGIAAAVAEAMDYAHRQGVVHRDVKPGNILLQDGQAVVTDFGIALAVGKAGGTRMTGTGMSLGTPQYMAPEQAMGEGPVGPAADIWALGCVLYEMLVGEPPYTGSTPQAVIGKIATAAFEPIRTRRPSVPAHVDAVVCKALEKLPADRFQDANELARALSDSAFRHGGAKWTDGIGGRSRRRLLLGSLTVTGVLLATWVGTTLGRPSNPVPLTDRIAVVPFEDLTGDEGQGGLGRAVAYTIANGLTNLEIAEIVPFQDVQLELGMLDTSSPNDVLAERTGATLLVVGSYHSIGGEVELQAQVIDPVEGVVVAAPSPARGPLGDPDGAVQAIVDRLIGAVAVHLDPDLRSTFSGAAPNLAAVRAFMDGNDHMARFELEEAEEDLRRAIAFDSTFFGAYWVLGIAALWNQERWGAIDSLVSVIDQRSLTLSDVDRARIDFLRWNLAGRRVRALEAIERAARISPGMPRFVAGIQAMMARQPRRGVEWLESMDRDVGFVRRWVPYWVILAATYHQLGRYQEEVETIQELDERFGRDWPVAPLHWSMRALSAIGQASAVEDSVAAALDEGWPLSAVFGVTALRAFGHTEAATRSARRVAEHLRQSDLGDDLIAWTALAEALALAGEYEKALDIHRRLAGNHPHDVDVQGRLGLAAALAGDSVEANQVARWLETVQQDYLWGIQHAWRVRIAAALGEPEQAVSALNQGLEEGLTFSPAAVPFGGTGSHMVGLWPSMEWVFEPIRDDPRFRRLIEPAG